MSSRRTIALVLGLCACKPEPVEAPELAAATPGPTEDLEAERDAVRDAVRRYVDALQARDAAAAVAAVVPETFGYYEDLRIAALRASRDQLESWGLMSVTLVLQIRLRSSRAQLEQLDGRALFEEAIVEGMAAEQVALDDVWIDEAGERAEIRIDGQPVLWLRKIADEHGRREWRMDLPTMIVELEPRFEALAREQVSAEGRVRMAYAIIELTSVDPVDLAILDGPLDTLPGDDIAP